MFFDVILKCIPCVWFVQSCPKPFQNAKYEWNFQIKFFWPTFNLFFHNMTNWQILQSRLKVGFKKGLIQLLKLSRTSTYHMWYPHVVQKDSILKHHLLSNLLVTNLKCFFTLEDYFLVWFSMLSPSGPLEKFVYQQWKQKLKYENQKMLKSMSSPSSHKQNFIFQVYRT
jgi:hypothetical protein